MHLKIPYSAIHLVAFHSLTFKQSLDSAHLLDHLSELIVLREEIVDFALRDAGAKRDSLNAPRLLLEQTIAFPVVQF